LRRKLLLLNAALVALTALAGWGLRAQWQAAQARERAVLRQRIRPQPPPPLTPLPPVPPVPATSYIDIAQKMLFSRDRNPIVIVEPPPPPPPPKPMPALPAVYGVMDLGDGAPTAMMSEKSGAPHRGVRPGEKFGEFKLLAVNSREIALEWEGKVVVKKLEELIDRAAPPESARTAAPAAGSSSAPAPQAPSPAKQGAPGVPMSGGVRACTPGDTSPPGTTAEGMRKVVTETPFGPKCQWEPVK
jgi:hypothetical protein